MIASVTCSLVALPPTSRVQMPAAQVPATAERIRSAITGVPSSSSIVAPDRIAPTGLATPAPTMSSAEPCTGSNIDGKRPSKCRFALGAIPRLPASAPVRSERMSP